MKRSFMALVPDLTMGLGIFLVTFYTVLEIGLNGVSEFIHLIRTWPIILLFLLAVVSLFFAVGYLLKLQIRHEKEIQGISDYYERALDTTDQGVSIIDQDYEVLFQNSVVEANFGGAIGGTCHEVYFERRTPCEGCQLADVIGKHKHSTSQRELQNGRIFEVTLAPFKNRDGRTVAVETMKDVTERERAEVALRKSETKYRNLISRMSEGIAVTDKGHFTFANPRLCEMLEYEELIGMNITDFIDDENRKILQDEREKLYGGEDRQYEVVLTAKSGRKIYALISASPIFEDEV